MSSVILANLSAKTEKEYICIKWITETEIENTGFNVLRSESNNGEFTKINKQLIPSRVSSAKSAQYSFVDETAIHSKLYFYKLECVPLKGNSTFLGPIYSVP
jgi:hypothetical protein